jgi:hypothetical protein
MHFSSRRSIRTQDEFLSHLRHAVGVKSLTPSSLTPSRSRGAMRPRLDGVHPRKRGRRECRALAAPAVPCAMGVVDTRTSIQGQRKHSGIPYVAALRLMPRSPRRRIRFCHRRWRIKADRTGWPDFASTSLTSATDARPTRFCRTLERRSFCAPAIPHGVQPAL